MSVNLVLGLLLHLPCGVVGVDAGVWTLVVVVVVVMLMVGMWSGETMAYS